MVEPGEQISKTLKKEFMEEALAGLDIEDKEREELKVQVDYLFQKGIEVQYMRDESYHNNSYEQKKSFVFFDVKRPLLAAIIGTN